MKPQTATHDYQKKLNVLNMLLVQLVTATTQHALKQSKEERNWGFNGDLARVQELVEDSIRALGSVPVL